MEEHGGEVKQERSGKWTGMAWTGRGTRNGGSKKGAIQKTKVGAGD